MRRSNLLDAGLCTERVCCRLFAIWQGLAYKGSWIHAGVHRSRRCSSDLGLSVQPPKETAHHQLLKTYTRRTTHAIHKFLCSCKIVWRRGHGCSGSWWPVRSKWPEDEHQFKLAVFRGTGNSRMGHLGQSCLNERHVIGQYNSVHRSCFEPEVTLNWQHCLHWYFVTGWVSPVAARQLMKSLNPPPLLFSKEENLVTPSTTEPMAALLKILPIVFAIGGECWVWTCIYLVFVFSGQFKRIWKSQEPGDNWSSHTDHRLII